MSVAEKSLFSQVIKVAGTFLVVPATNSIGDRSFSAMRHIKTYLRSTMLQERLNSVMVMHVHQDFTDNLNLNFIMYFAPSMTIKKINFLNFNFLSPLLLKFLL